MDMYIWIAIIVLLTFAEATSVSLTTIWYVASGVIALIISIFSDNFMFQFGAFAVIGSVLLITTRPLLSKILVKKNVATNADRVIGMEAIVTEEIAKNKNGEVKVDGKKWTAYSDKELSVNTTVKVIKIDGVKLKVEKVGE